MNLLRFPCVILMITAMSRMRTAASVVLVGLLLASSCGDDSDPVSGPDSTGSTTLSTTTTVVVAGEPADDESAEPAPCPSGCTASDIGVTPEAIKVAAVYPDLTFLGYNSGDVGAKFQAAVDRVNDAGGVNGREIDLLFDYLIPTDLEYERACVRHTEDEGVFAAIGVFLSDQALCYTEFHDTIVVNASPIDEGLLERSTAPLLSSQPLASRNVGRNLDALIDGGHLEPGMRVALHGIVFDEAIHLQYKEELEARGVDVVVSSLRSIVSGGLDERIAEVGVFALRWLSEDVDAVIASRDVVTEDLLAQYGLLDLDMPMLLPAGIDRPASIMTALTGISTDPFVHAVAVITEPMGDVQYEAGSNGMRECVDGFEAASGETVELLELAGSDGVANLTPTIAACTAVDLFTAVARAAGPDLTTESFGEAAASYGPIDLTFITDGSLGPGKPDASDSPPLVAFFDFETDTFRPA